MDDFSNMQEWSHHPQLAQIKARLSEPGALTASLNWYRANVNPESLVQPAIEFPPVAAPTMGIWGSADFALGERQMVSSADHVSGPWRYERLEGLDHWVMLEDPERVSALLIDFLPAP